MKLKEAPPKAEKLKIEQMESVPEAIRQAGELAAREGGLVDALPEERVKILTESGRLQRWISGTALATMMAGMLAMAPAAEAGEHRRYVGHSRGYGIGRVYEGIEDSKQDQKESELDQLEEQLEKVQMDRERLEQRLEKAESALADAKRKVVHELAKLKELNQAVVDAQSALNANAVRQQLLTEKIKEAERSLRNQQMRRSIVRGVLEEVRGPRY